MERQQKYLLIEDPQLRFYGDDRDRDRLRRIFECLDTVNHTVVLKPVPAADYNPIEYIFINVLSAENGL